MFGLCEAKNGTEINELLQAIASRHQRVWQDVKADSRPGGLQVPAKEARNWKIGGLTRKEYQRLSHKLKMEGFMAQKGMWKLAGENVLKDRVE